MLLDLRTDGFQRGEILLALLRFVVVLLDSLVRYGLCQFAIQPDLHHRVLFGRLGGAGDQGDDLGIFCQVLAAGFLQNEFPHDQLLQRDRDKHVRRLRLQLRRQHADHRQHIRAADFSTAHCCHKGICLAVVAGSA